MRALLSVYDKEGIVDFAKELLDMGWEIISSGGTARVLHDAGLEVVDVADITGTPAILGHRVVTLHPKIHGGILADPQNISHQEDMKTYGITPIDLVVVNLYPFSSQPSIELLDIGGPTMVRAAAKNYAHVGVIVETCDYAPVLAELREQGTLTVETRKRLAGVAFTHTYRYDEEIVHWFAQGCPDPGAQVEKQQVVPENCEALPEHLTLEFTRQSVLRYGENPHQHGAQYSVSENGVLVESWWDTSVVHGGKEMSYLNVYDADAAWELVHALGDKPSCVVIKHANPCGVAQAETLLVAYEQAHACDPVSAFGGIVAFNREVDEDVAEKLSQIFTEVVIAPSYTPSGLARLQEKKNVRILSASPPKGSTRMLRSIDGGFLVQTPDIVQDDPKNWKVVTEKQPTAEQWEDLLLAWRVVAKVNSNAIVLVKDGQAFGIGCGQQNRRDAGQLAAEKADGRAKGGAYASDAFFPFPDGLDAAIQAGAATVIQPGGSIRDDEVIAAANEAGLVMVFTGERHFRH